jgi:hypothetical protein
MAIVRDQIDDVRVAKPCCSDFRQLKFEELPGSQETPVRVTADDQVYLFKSGPSRVKAFRLGLGKEKLHIRALQPFLNNSHEGRAVGTYVHPSVVFLNTRFEEISTVDPSSVRWCEGRTCSGYLFTASIPTGALYAVIFTPFEKLGSTQLHDTRRPDMMHVLQGIPVMIPGGPGVERNVATPLGELRIWVW